MIAHNDNFGSVKQKLQSLAYTKKNPTTTFWDRYNLWKSFIHRVLLSKFQNEAEI